MALKASDFQRPRQTDDNHLVWVVRGSLFEATEAEVFGTAYLSAYYFSKNNPKGLVYIMGSEAMESELNAMGFKSIGVGKGTIYSLYY